MLLTWFFNRVMQLEAIQQSRAEPCDWWKPDARFTNRIQRCWAHLLRESKDIAEKFEEAIPLHNALKELYEILTEALENDPPPEVRKTLWQLAREALRHWITKEYSIESPKIHWENQQRL